MSLTPEARAEYAHRLSCIAHDACNGHCRHDVGIHLMRVCQEYSADILAQQHIELLKLCEEAGKMVYVEDVRKILEER